MDKKALIHYRGNEELVARMEDWINQSKYRHRVIVTPFLTPDKQDIARALIGNACEYHFDGGYEGAVDRRLILGGGEGADIVLLRGCYGEKYASLDHRDLLGALMNCGIERENFGDLYVQDGYLYIFASTHMASYIQMNVTQIKRSKVHFEIIYDIPQFKVDIQWRNDTLASYRCDVIIASCAKLSREKARLLIKNGFVKINNVILEDCSRVCNNNSTISIRGHGRFILRYTSRITKKGNHVVEIGKYC